MNDKTGRNDFCPCGSGQKYKKCCLKKDTPLRSPSLKQSYYKKYNIRIKDEKDIDGIRKAGLLVVDTLEKVKEFIKADITTDDINTLVHEHTLKNGGIPAPLNYRNFPKSVCVSVNNVICHGIPGPYIIQAGDIVNVDITTILDGYFADASMTFFIGKPNENAQKIVDVTRESLKRGMKAVKPGNTTGDIGWSIQSFVESHGCSVVREYVGHGIGFEFHESPHILHYGKKGSGIPLVEGMVFTIEPMINLGNRKIKTEKDGWTVVTADGSLSAQFEQTILVTENGYESLTPFNL
ncbi:MAG: type I methionyl aminopeptidase [Proteobacteria bacterium]|nr:type I methionyl aminopeptidase [Pseudomonadota bacterium]